MIQLEWCLTLLISSILYWRKNSSSFIMLKYIAEHPEALIDFDNINSAVHIYATTHMGSLKPCLPVYDRTISLRNVHLDPDQYQTASNIEWRQRFKISLRQVAVVLQAPLYWLHDGCSKLQHFSRFWRERMVKHCFVFIPRITSVTQICWL